ncbi:uncharacterized protein LOC100878753 [Megachile rotundata]|uniref:uncharacterized protein LOC100878753 n=1 Tax=Megachile rotundata TaxID=143995 RepID=UPI003FD290E0
MNAGSRHLPYDVWRGIDFIDSPEFEIIFVSQILASIVASCAVGGLDGTCVAIILHLSGQFRLITTWLSNIGIEMQYNRIDLHNCPPSVSADLIKCIRHHQRLIKVLQDVNSLLTPIIFMQVFTSSIVFCLGGYAILSNNTTDDLFKFVSYILSMTIQLLLWCWPGEILIQESLHIGYAVYVNVPWYKLPPFYRRQLCLIVLRSQKTCSLSAFIFHSLSIYTLTNVLNTAFSYFALLRQIQDKNIFANLKMYKITQRFTNLVLLPSGVGCILTSLAQCLFKTIYLVARKERSHRLYKELRSLWDSTDDPKEMQCYQDLAHVARTCTITFYSCGALTSIVFIISAALECMNVDVSNGTDSIRPLPFEVWYGIDVSESPRFEVVFVCQALASTICAVAICSLDTACVTAILHVCGQFKLISVWISHIGFETDCNLTNYLVDSRRNLRTDLVKCIRHQQRLINVVKDVNTLMTPIIFIQILTSGIEICLSGFAVFSYDAGGDLFKFISYLASMMVQLLLWCWPGEILAQESQKIGHSVYLNIPWYQLPLIYRKKILLMILRSQKYCSISALTFQSLSIYTLTSNVLQLRMCLTQLPPILLCYDKYRISQRDDDSTWYMVEVFYLNR